MTDHIMTPSEKLRSIASSIGIVCIANAIREVAEEIEHTAPVVSQDMRIVPVWLLERVERSLGSFTSDEGWAQTDMATMDSVSALLVATPALEHAVPQGWKLVPVEPTDAMVDAAHHAGWSRIDIYSAMLAATPAPAPAITYDQWQQHEYTKVLQDRIKELSEELAIYVQARAPAQDEPFGHFRAEPFGWTDCAKDDEGAIALYERPQEVGLTDEGRQQVFIAAERRMVREPNLSWRDAIVDEVIEALRAKGASDA